MGPGSFFREKKVGDLFGGRDFVCIFAVEEGLFRAFFDMVCKPRRLPMVSRGSEASCRQQDCTHAECHPSVTIAKELRMNIY